MSYILEYTPTSLSNLGNLNPDVRKRIVNKIDWLAENFDQITPQALTSDLAGFYKLRVGDYRVIYEFSREDKIIFIDRVGHRREIYT